MRPIISREVIKGQKFLSIFLKTFGGFTHALHVQKFSKGGVDARLMNQGTNLEVQCLCRDGSEFSDEISLLKMEFEKERIWGCPR